MKRCYVPKSFARKHVALIDHANAIIEQYQAQGFVLTLRQLYYQFVARDLLANTQRNYKMLGSVVSDARLAGKISWTAIEDRTRSMQKRSHWEDPAGVIDSAANSYGKDLWRGQSQRVEVWIEKDALTGVIERPCTEWDVPYFACKGYTSMSELWRAAIRHKDYGVPVTVLHFGDHDPSGIDMTRDVQDRLRTFGAPTEVVRMALNMDQVREFNPPPNPVKATDSRHNGYRDAFGDECWELDALEPTVIDRLIRDEIGERVDTKKFRAEQRKQETERELLREASNRWDEVEDMLR